MTQLPEAGHAGRGGLALPQEGTGPVCVSRLSPSRLHHSTGTPTELPLSLVAPRESPERLCPERALLRLCCRAECGTASTDTSTSMVTPSLQTDTGLRAVAQRGTSPIPAQHSGSGEGCLEGMCHSPSPLSTAPLTCRRHPGPHSAYSLQGPLCWLTGCPLPAALALGVGCGCCWGGRQRGLELHPHLVWGWAALTTAHSLGRKRMLFPGSAPRWSREGTGQGLPPVWDLPLARFSSSTTPRSPGVRLPLEPQRFRHSDSTTVPYT